MANEMTPQQKQAVDFDLGTCLVSAGAGAGKTKVLTTRVSDLVEQGKAELSQLLVLTFTNKAAFEIKDRVRKAIAGHPNPAVRAKAPEVEGAMIATFDSFCLDLVTRYHYELGIDQEISLVPQDIIDIQISRTLKEILEERSTLAVAGEDEAFARLVNHCCVKNMDFVIGIIKKINSEGDLKENKADFLMHGVDENFSEAFFAKGIEACYRRAIELLNQAKDVCRYYENADMANQDIATLEEALACPDYESLRAKFADMRFPTAKKGTLTDADTLLRDKIVKGKCVAKAKEFVKSPIEEALDKFFGTKEDAVTLFEIARELEKRMNAWKKKYAAYSFSDIAALARRLVQRKDVAKKLHEQYRYAMIDEYQDTSDLQDQLIEAIQCPSLFMVGDIKQSIYRFRNANPKNFQARMNAYRRGKQGTLITLPDNFRSRRQVIEGINEIFKNIMSEPIGGVDYSANQALQFGNHSYDSSENNEKYGIRVYRYTAVNDEKEVDEAELIAKDIVAKIKDGYRLQGSGEQGRACRFADFAILVRAKRLFPIFQRAFNKYGIPLEVVAPKIDHPKDVTLVCQNLLRLAKESSHGYPDMNLTKRLYASLMRSYLFAASDKKIYEAVCKRANLPEEPLLQQVRQLTSASSSLSDLFEGLCHRFGVVEKLPLLGDVKGNYEEIDQIRRFVETFGRFHWSLDDLVDHLDFAEKEELSKDEAKGAIEADAVKIMTIHASKGLEFPIIYLPYLYAKPKSGGGSISYSRNYGVLLENQDTAFASTKGIFHLLDSYENRQEDKSERMRLFYVALTRAKETAILLLPNGVERCPHLVKARSLGDFFECADFENANNTFDADSLLEQKTEPLEKEKEECRIEFKTIEAKAKEITKKRASKGLLEPIDQGLLRYGETLHRYLELSDVRTKDVSWIEDRKIREKIEKVLSLPVFENAAKARQFHEYSFLLDDGGEAIIDLFLLYDDHIDLIDFKASNIDDPSYGKQLSVYADFLKKAFCLRVDSYLVSISQGRQVKIG